MQKQSLYIPVPGGQMPSYVARPDGDEPRPAVIVLQEIFGVNTQMKRITDLVASAGYVGLAINYYWRTHPNLDVPYDEEGRKVGFAAAGALTKANLRSDVQAAIDWLNAQPFVKKGAIATWGFCMGGAVAFATATLPGIKGAIAFYGGAIAKPFPNDARALDDAAEVKAPLLLAFGGQDHGIPLELVDEIKATLEGLGKPYECLVYPDVGHAFFRGADMNQKEVADAWDKVQAFLHAHLS